MGVGWCHGASSLFQYPGTFGKKGLKNLGLQWLLLRISLTGVSLRIGKCAMIRKEFQNLNVGLVLHNWEARLGLWTNECK